MRISVVIPCFNAEAFLAQTVRSALNQTLAPAEIIVVDNGSTDRSLEIARSFGGRVSVLSEPRRGAPLARNVGAAVATGDALMFLDADDLLGPTVLEELGRTLARHPGQIACAPWRRFEEVGGCWHARPPSCAPRRRGQDDLSAWLTGWYHPPCSVLWSQAAYARTGGWDPQVKVNQDGDVMMRGFIAGNRLVATERGVAYYRRLPGEQVSVSGARLTRGGVESRLFVVNKIAAALHERGRLAAYRGPLGEAYDAIAETCRTQYPDLYRRCRSAARQWAGPEWRRRLAGAPVKIGASAARAGGRLRGRLASATAQDHRPRPPPATRTATADEPQRPAAAEQRPTVSVIVPTYNRAHLLPRTLRSVLNQTFRDFEVLVVDDGSDDGTAELMATYDDPRLVYLPQDCNRGVAAARNRGLREARGRFIAFLDSDDEWSPEKLALQLEVFAGRSERLGLVYTGVESLIGDHERRLDRPKERGDLYHKMLLRNVIHGGGSNAMIRASVVETVGVFDETLPAIEDYDYWLRISRFFEVDYAEAPLLRYYDEAPGGPSSRDDERRSRNFAGNMQARAEFFQRYRHEMRRAQVDHQFLLDSAKRHLNSPFGSPAAARRLALKAVLARPGSAKLYVWGLCALLPRGPRRWVHDLALRVRDRVQPGREERLAQFSNSGGSA